MCVCDEDYNVRKWSHKDESLSGIIWKYIVLITLLTYIYRSWSSSAIRTYVLMRQRPLLYYDALLFYQEDASNFSLRTLILIQERALAGTRASRTSRHTPRDVVYYFGADCIGRQHTICNLLSLIDVWTPNNSNEIVNNNGLTNMHSPSILLLLG